MLGHFGLSWPFYLFLSLSHSCFDCIGAGTSFNEFLQMDAVCWISSQSMFLRVDRKHLLPFQHLQAHRSRVHMYGQWQVPALEIVTEICQPRHTEVPSFQKVRNISLKHLSRSGFPLDEDLLTRAQEIHEKWDEAGALVGVRPLWVAKIWCILDKIL